MYLKRLELYGFKSFASRTIFDFGQGITAIVGPNGSGKSNIADALRWVLGEQSNKLIRAKKIEDVIYAGSEKRGRSDKVEVTLTLDNSDGWLPVEADEVAIMRRGSRSGDSDYYLNGRKAKLRDIQLLLATAKVSQNSYAIIGQGLVESVLNLRPEDRREMIEEAADIQRYRLKIEEAEDRLKQTHENVQRVKLLIKEIAPRMQQLERQASRAGEHARLSLRLMQSLQAYYEHRWALAQESLTVARAAHDQATAEFTQARVSLETVQRELDEVTRQLDESRQVAAATLAERDRLTDRVSELERRLAVGGERRSILRGRRDELSEEIAGVEGERERAAAVLASGDSERERLSRAVEQARQLLRERQQDLGAAEGDMRESYVHAADAEAKAKRLESAATEMQVRIRRLTEAADALEREADRLEIRRKSIITQMAEQLRVLQSLRVQDAQFMTDNSQTGTRRQRLEAEVSDLRATLAEIEATQNSRKGKLEGMEARLRVLEDAQKQNSRDPASGIEGAHGTIFDGLRVPRGLEDAIAAVLRDNLEAFVFEHQDDAVMAVESLVRQSGPRAVALPIDAIKQVYPLSLMKEKGVVGVASQLVKYPPKYEKLMNMLLGRVIVVQDVATAVRLLKRRVGTIVTMDGIVFDQSGAISGGKEVEARGFIIEFERDIEVIPKEIQRIRHSITATENEAEIVRGKLRTAETSLSAVQDESERALTQRIQLQESIAGRQQKLAQLRGELRGLMANMSNVREQQVSYRGQAETLESERRALIEEARQAMETSRHLGRADGVFDEQRKALQQAVDDGTDALSRVDAELRSLSVQKENAEAAVGRLEAQASGKKMQLRGVELELTTLDEEMERDETRLTQARAELDALLEHVPSLEGTKHLEARQKDLHSQVMGDQSRMFDAERKTLETEAAVQKWQTEIDTLKGRVAEDGLAIAPDGSVVVAEQPEQVELPGWLAIEREREYGERPPLAGGQDISPDALAKEIEGLRSQIRALGPVNVEAQGDYESLRERHDFLSGQVEDLKTAEESLKRAISQLTELMRKKFDTTFEMVARGFEENFAAFFGGGHAKLTLTDKKHPMEAGVEIEARPPGKRTKSLGQLSGGEKSLTSVSLLFALLQANPSPFCVLDEVDAMLDESNVGRFAAAVRDQADKTQFVVITHNRRTIEVADSIYGISMAPDAASRVLSMRLGDVPLDAVGGAASQN
ncbi:MAG TPA: chromosome segregation protein SMC [Dehalococcoidia bacterium]|nr:chromosome segregation protein SMC [Dehalococcoidia bacterium]